MMPERTRKWEALPGAREGAWQERSLGWEDEVGRTDAVHRSHCVHHDLSWGLHNFWAHRGNWKHAPPQLVLAAAVLHQMMVCTRQKDKLVSTSFSQDLDTSKKDCRENSSDSCISFLLIFKLAELSASRGSGSLGEKTPASCRNPSKINTGLRLLFQVFSSSHTMPQNSSEIIWARKFPSDASPKSCLYEGSQTWSIPGNSQWLTLKPSILIQLLLCKCCPSNFFSKNSCFKYASTSSSSNSSAHVSAFLSSYTALVEIGEENRQHYIKGKWHWCILDYICCKAFGRVVLELSESHYFSPQALLYSGPSFLHASAVKKLQCNYNQQLNEYICVPLPIHKYSDGPHMQVSVKLQLLHGQTRFMHHWCITHASINEVTSPRITLYQNQSDLSTKSALAACVEYLHQPARITGNAFLCKTVKKKKPAYSMQLAWIVFRDVYIQENICDAV